MEYVDQSMPANPRPPPMFCLCVNPCAMRVQTVSKEEASTARAKVFEDLGWHHLVEGDKKWAVIGHPKSFALF